MLLHEKNNKCIKEYDKDELEKIKKIISKYELNKEEFNLLSKYRIQLECACSLDYLVENGYLIYNVALVDVYESHIIHEIKYVPDEVALKKECNLRVLNELKDLVFCDFQGLKMYLDNISKINSIFVDERVTELIDYVVSRKKEVSKLEKEMGRAVRKMIKDIQNDVGEY